MDPPVESSGDYSALPIAIIGGGMQGLAAARFLQKRGARCVIFERRASLGGVWSADDGPANAHSLVQTEPESYSLDLVAGDGRDDDDYGGGDDDYGGGDEEMGEGEEAPEEEEGEADLKDEP